MERTTSPSARSSRGENSSSSATPPASSPAPSRERYSAVQDSPSPQHIHHSNHHQHQQRSPIFSSSSSSSQSVTSSVGSGNRRSSSPHPSAGDLAASSNASPQHPSRDWRKIHLSELVQNDRLVFVDGDTPVETAFEMMQVHKFTSLPIRVSADDLTVSNTFDYSDLNAYLLLVLGRYNPPSTSPQFAEYVKQAREGEKVPVNFAASLGVKDPFITLPESTPLLKIVEIFGSGVHRISISKDNSEEVIGILSQRRLVRWFWNHLRQLGSLEPWLQSTIQQLGIGSSHVVSIQGDAPLLDALDLMNEEGISSLAVIDSTNNLLGNISIVDVKLVSKSTSAHLLKSSCRSFLSIILSTRGMIDGKDSFPVFDVTRQATMVTTIAKLVATKAHRLWVVEKHSIGSTEFDASGSLSPSHTGTAGVTISKLVGVVSLTDVLNSLYKSTGSSVEPTIAREQRRRSSSSSSRSFTLDQSVRRSSSIERPVAPRR